MKKTSPTPIIDSQLEGLRTACALGACLAASTERLWRWQVETLRCEFDAESAALRRLAEAADGGQWLAASSARAEARADRWSIHCRTWLAVTGELGEEVARAIDRARLPQDR